MLIGHLTKSTKHIVCNNCMRKVRFVGCSAAAEQHFDGLQLTQKGEKLVRNLRVGLGYTEKCFVGKSMVE